MKSIFLFTVCFLLFGTVHAQQIASAKAKVMSCCEKKLPPRFTSKPKNLTVILKGQNSVGNHKGMVWIKGNQFTMGSSTKEGRPDEYPRHRVKVNSFWMDETEVTNAQFERFVKATGYMTTAEKAINWNDLKKQLPPGTPKPNADELMPASLVFKQPARAVSLNDPSQWWSWVKGANWRHPEGPKSNIKGRENYPVVHVSWYDANAFAKWAGKRLPTEAEWEFASRGGLTDKSFSWGEEDVTTGKAKANIWDGHFPDRNTGKDGFIRLAPVRSYSANGYGLYDMAGNVWEWCSDWYRPDYYRQFNGSVAVNPAGPSSGFDPDEPNVPKRVIRGGSFLCNASYCSSYRVSARMKTSPDTGLEHTGFRCVSDK